MLDLIVPLLFLAGSDLFDDSDHIIESLEIAVPVDVSAAREFRTLGCKAKWAVRSPKLTDLRTTRLR